jgi:phage/plasmid primase-like uncharacterized protein
LTLALVLEKAGLDLQGQPPQLDGMIHRVPVIGAPGNEIGGAYFAYPAENGNPASGWAQNFAGGERTPWIATGHVLSEDVRREMIQEREQQKVDLSERMSLLYEETAAQVANVLLEIDPASNDHPFLKEHEIESFGLFQQREDNTNSLYVPVANNKGQVRGLYIISERGEGRYMFATERAGNFHLIPGADGKELDQGEIVLAQGYAAGASLHMATGDPVAVAFEASNLEPVAKALREKYPQAEITICPDNNQYERADGTVDNRGVKEAERAAEAVGGKVVVPDFDDQEKMKGFLDFNDLHISRGLEEVRRQIDLGREKSRDAGLERGLSL